MSRYEKAHASTADSAGFIFPCPPGIPSPSLDVVQSMLQIYDYVPILLATRVSALDVSVLYRELDPGTPSVLLESSGPGRHARYSIIAFDPFLSKSHTFSGPSPGDDPLAELLKSSRAADLHLPHYCGGPICAWGYGAGLAWQGLPVVRQGPMSDLPDLFFFLPRQVAVYDHHEQILRAIYWVSGAAKAAAAAYEIGCNQLQQLQACARAVAGQTSPRYTINHDPDGLADNFQSNMDQHHYQGLVETAKQHITCGDIFQAVISQRWERVSSAHPWEVYLTQRQLNPSPYMFYLQGPDFTVLGASPETQLRIVERTATIHPIAGTRPLTGDEARDAQARQDLNRDEKERAEHLMLVDLARNDVGRVSTPGSVRVPSFMVTESYSHVMHLVSEVNGQLKPELAATDAFRSCFPAGTLSGAPKRKAMEIIASLEPDSRGIYGGAIGYVDFNGNLDSGIAIRTMVYHRGTYYLQSGAGIVADSDPDREYEETLNKARAMMVALMTTEGRR